MSTVMHSPDKWLSFGLAYVGGFGDAAGFVLAKTFPGHITGSLVLGAIATAAHDWHGTLAHLTATACFLTGIPVSAVIARLTVTRSCWPFLPLGIEVILITAAYFVLAFGCTPGREIFVVCMSLALGLQNGAFRRTGGISVHTNYLTGMITGLLAAETESHALPTVPHFSIATDPKTGLLYGVWGTFVLGAVTGAAIVLRFRERGILAIVLVLFGLMARDLAVPRPADSAS